ncbi:hypothetical protein C8R43DRAFT_872384 [Mycena crocata]|nr:hypothetical protein C8R43DRAFT_872384 [Mycena crocata]
MTSPSAKRQRTENAPITRSNIWYEDGGVVLQAQDTQFRVHWSILAQQSSFFRDMQGLPQPVDQPSVDGCPVIELPDSVEDVRYLLKALYTPSVIQPASLWYTLTHVHRTFLEHAIPLAAVAAFIRLGRKYAFAELLNSAVARLTFVNPITLEDYDTPCASERIVGYSGIRIDMLTLARETNILTALPCAYLRVVTSYTLVNLLDGSKRSDGTTASLTAVDQRECLLGREKLLKAQVQKDSGYTFGWMRSSAFDDCTNPTRCGPLRAACIRICMDNLCVNALIKVSTLCNPCKRHMEDGREKIWENLPTFFGLPPWNELKNDL